MLIGILADIHEDVFSLENALGFAEHLKCDSLVCLGDITGCTPKFYKYKRRSASECINLVQKNCQIVIPGNHDLFACKKFSSFSTDFSFPADWFELKPEERSRIAQDKVWDYLDDEYPEISDNDKDYLRSLKEIEILSSPELNILFSHFCFPDFSGSSKWFPEKKKDLIPHIDYVEKMNCSISFSGHAHPEGLLVCSNNGLGLIPFGKSIDSENLKWISVPCLAAGKRKTGFTTFDTSAKLIQSFEFGAGHKTFFERIFS